MPLGRPRRIFRASPQGSPLALLRPAVRHLHARHLLVGIVALGLAGGGAWVLRDGRLAAYAMSSVGALSIGDTKLASGDASAASAHVAAEPAQIAVLDGDTLRLRDVVVRLLGIAAPPRGENCRGADGTGFDCGAAATNALADMVRARKVDCRLAGHDGMGHPLGVCEASGRQINRALVAAGYARAEASLAPQEIGLQATDLRGEEDQARAQRRGLWAGGRAASW